jgi:hypothetical protein
MVLDFDFWNDLKNSDKSKYPSVVKKHYLTPYDLERVSSILKSGKLENEWFNQLYIKCLGCGFSKAEILFEKYNIQEEGLKQKIIQRWMENENKQQYKGD